MNKCLAFFLSALAALSLAACQGGKSLFPPFYTLDDTVEVVQTLEDFGRATYQQGEKTPLHLVYTGTPNATPILFIHGSPGSWEAWAEYLYDAELRANAFMVAVDRPGYGGSDNGISGSSLTLQSDVIMAALKTHFPQHSQWIIAGHSYGGPVALRIAADYPKRTAHALLLAPAISPDLVGTRWYNQIADTWLVSALLPTSLNRSNDEMFLLKDELKQMRPALGGIRAPITVIQGEKDGIVAPGNAAFATSTLKNATVNSTLLPENGHFLPWEEFLLIKQTLLEAMRSHMLLSANISP